MLVGEVLKEQVGRAVEGVDHAPNVLQIVARNSTWAEECGFVNLVDFWRVSEKRETESCDGVAEANAEV